MIAVGAPQAPLSGLVSFGTSGPGSGSRAEVATGHVRRWKKKARGILNGARLMQESLTDAGTRFRVAMVTLTYRADGLWDARHISQLLRCYRRWCKARKALCRYVWSLEPQGKNNGRPHYHVLFWLPRGLTPPLPDKAGWWKHGHTQAVWAYRPVGYIAKYVGKGTADMLPRGARLWGCGGLPAVARIELRRCLCPVWLKPFVAVGEVVKRIGNGWWRNCTTAYEFRSPWDFDLWSSSLRWRGWTTEDVQFVPA